MSPRSGGKFTRLDAENEMLFAIRAAGLPEPETQYRYAPPRLFRADFAWPDHRLLLEVQGGVFNRRAHGSVSGVLRDIERLNVATLAGWRLLRVTPDDVRSGEALDLIERALRAPLSAAAPATPAPAPSGE